MALILLRENWAQEGEYGDRNGQGSYGYYYRSNAWHFNTETLKVVYAYPYGTYNQDFSAGGDSNPPEDYYKPLDEVVHEVPGPGTITAYFYDGFEGVNTLELTLELITAICFGSSSGELDLQVGGTLPGPFTFAWSDGPTEQERGLVPVGTYSATVYDVPTGAKATVSLKADQNPRINVDVQQQGSTVTLVVIGGMAPYTYLWDDNSTLDHRDDIAPGSAFSCVVTDAVGCTQTVNLDYEAYKLYFSRNAITQALDAGDEYRADPTTMPNLSFVCEVFVEEVNGSGDFTQVATVLEQPADREGRTVFEVQELLSPYLRQFVPELGQKGIVRASSQYKRFYLHYAPKFGTPPERDAIAISTTHFVLLGGLSFREARSEAWNKYATARRPFLTWEPVHKAVFADQPEFLYWLVPGTLSGVKLQVLCYYSDDTSAPVAGPSLLAPLVRGEVLCLPVGRRQLGLNDEGEKLLVGWDVWVESPDGLTTSEVRHYELLEEDGPRRYVLYANSLGGMNTFVATGEAALELEVSGDDVELSLPWDYDPQLGDTSVQERVLRPVLKLASGLRTRAEMAAHQDLLLTRQALLIAQGQLLSGVIKPKTVPLVEDGKYINTLELDFYLPRERSFTPLLPNLPAGMVVPALPTLDELLP
jgi:hypothetical protein